MIKLLKNKFVLIGIGAVILLIAVGLGGYYWWTGTPEYSLGQLKKAMDTHNPELGLKYVDTDAVFESFWTEFKDKITSEALTQPKDGFEAFGTLLGLQLVENMKPTIKKQMEDGIKGWFSTDQKTTEQNAENKTINLKSEIQNKNIKIKKDGKTVYIELPDDIKIILTRKAGERYWVISGIQGLSKNISLDNK
ncbi:MAG TPA: hypothetical protein VG941_03040 [Candidatus Paceibacterota bacterium]|nr:hypothetical protein [Candidatus Paceibacterota bacterium]